MEQLLKKEHFDQTIAIYKKYFRTGDTDYLPKLMILIEEDFGPHNEQWVHEILSGITCKGQNYNEPYETYYKVFEVLGYKIVDTIMIGGESNE